MLEKNTKNEQDLLFPEQLFSIQEIQEVKQSIPDAPGAYAAYFKELPPFPKPLPKDLHVFCNKTLLYIGISEKDLRKRINDQHLGKSAHGSTTRRSIGVMFRYGLRDHRKKKLGEELRDYRDKTKKGKIPGYTTRFTNTNEALLSDWLGSNVYFAYTELEEDIKEFENELLNKHSTPLNIQFKTDDLSIAIRDMIGKSYLEARAKDIIFT